MDLNITRFFLKNFLEAIPKFLSSNFEKVANIVIFNTDKWLTEWTLAYWSI